MQAKDRGELTPAQRPPVRSGAYHDEQRAVLLGLDKPHDELTDTQAHLQCIILCAPLSRFFDANRVDAPALYLMQEKFFALRSEFVSSRSWERLIELAGELCRLDNTLSRNSSAWDIRHPRPSWLPAPGSPEMAEYMREDREPGCDDE